MPIQSAWSMHQLKSEVNYNLNNSVPSRLQKAGAVILHGDELQKEVASGG